MRRGILFSLLLGWMLFPEPAHAAVQGCNLTQVWNWSTTELYWEWTEPVNPPPSGLRLKLGVTSRVYTITKDFPSTHVSVKLSTLITAPTKATRYFAVIQPLDGATPGEESAECFFDLGRGALALGVRKAP